MLLPGLASESLPLPFQGAASSEGLREITGFFHRYPRGCRICRTGRSCSCPSAQMFTSPWIMPKSSRAAVSWSMSPRIQPCRAPSHRSPRKPVHVEVELLVHFPVQLFVAEADDLGDDLNDIPRRGLISDKCCLSTAFTVSSECELAILCVRRTKGHHIRRSAPAGSAEWPDLSPPWQGCSSCSACAIPRCSVRRTPRVPARLVSSGTAPAADRRVRPGGRQLILRTDKVLGLTAVTITLLAVALGGSTVELARGVGRRRRTWGWTGSCSTWPSPACCSFRSSDCFRGGPSRRCFATSGARTCSTTW